MLDINKLGGVEMKWNYSAFVDTLAKTKNYITIKTNSVYYKVPAKYREEGLYTKEVTTTSGAFKKVNTTLAKCLGAPRPAGRVGVVTSRDATEGKRKHARNVERKHNIIKKIAASESGW